MVVICRIIIKGRHVISPEILKTQAQDQLHVNHMGIEKKQSYAHISVYWVNIDDDTENHIRNCATCLTFHHTHPKDKMIHHDFLTRPWKVIGTDMLTLNIKLYLCIGDYHTNFPMTSKTEDLSADSLILTCKVIFTENGLPKKIMLDSGGNFVSDKFRTFCKSLNMEQAFSSSHHSKGDPHLALLQIHMTPVGPGLHCPVIMLCIVVLAVLCVCVSSRSFQEVCGFFEQ